MSEHSQDVPNQIAIPWPIVIRVSWAGIKRRFLRAMITLVGIVLAIAFISYMLVMDSISSSLVSLDISELNILLLKAGIDIHSAGKTDEMALLLMSLTILTCTIGILNSMLMAVTERIREIGTLKCLGARDQFIVRLYFIESTLQGVAGALIGLVLGFVVAVAASMFQYGMYIWQGFPILSIAGNLAVAFLVGLAMAVVSSIIPAYSAARKQPIEALRVEE